ncbi:MAG: hypothetical protein B7C24_05115 [Bacteroidetes bacterium 4572_77]|nr:MAG: hypothetical protein B7C24_05115 [Bacteroidetes bacterium 4572_77]
MVLFVAKKNMLPKFLQKTINIHLLAWVSYFIILLLFYSNTVNVKLAYYWAIQAVVLHSSLFYLNTIVLIPKFLDKKKYTTYLFTILLLVFVSIAIIHLANTHLNPMAGISPQGRSFSKPILTDEARNIKNLERIKTVRFAGRLLRHSYSIIAILLLSIVYKMIQENIRKEKKEISLQNAYLVNEMKFLKSQMNPHFLFNSLNNIYALVQLKDDSAPAMLMHLSNMLRYMLYECNDEYVSIEKEMNYINNYVELQQLKTKKKQNIKTNVRIDNKSIPIPPLLLIPFIENSFKHSIIEQSDKAWVSFQLELTAERLHFKISNSKPKQIFYKDKTGGIGLDNIRRRLELLYTNNYDLKIFEDQETYIVELIINMKNDEMPNN